MRIWNEIELHKSGEKSRAFLADNLNVLFEIEISWCVLR